MSPDTLLFTDQGHINKLIFILQFAHTVDDVRLVVSPLDTEFGAGHDDEVGVGVSPVLFYITSLS